MRWNDKTCCRWKQSASTGSRYQLEAWARATCQCRVQMALKGLGKCSRLADWSHFKSGTEKTKAVDIPTLTCPTQSLYASASETGPLNPQVSGNMLTVTRCYVDRSSHNSRETFWLWLGVMLPTKTFEMRKYLLTSFPAKAKIQCRSHFENLCAAYSWTRVEKIAIP